MSEHDDADELLTTTEARMRLGISRQKMARLIDDEILPWEKHPLDKRVKLIRRADLDELQRRLQRMPRAKNAA